MSRVFLSHSSRDAVAALALKAWLEDNEPGLVDEIFVDLDPDTGIPAGVRWKEALRRANERCEAVICLLTVHWDNSYECKTEYRTAEDRGKPIFPVRLEPATGRDMTDEWQRCDLFGDGPKTAIKVDGHPEPVRFVTAGLLRLQKGLRAAGIAPDSFAWPPEDEPDRAPYRGWQPLEDVDAAIYFGRDAQINRALTTIRELRSAGENQRFMILGPSGVGKSSFLRAGLLPRLRRDDRHFLVMDIVRPQRHPLTGQHGLARSVHALRERLGLSEPVLGVIKAGVGEPAQVRGWLVQAQHAAVDRFLAEGPVPPPPTIVLPVDQAEELLGADASEEAGVFLTTVAGLLRDGQPTLPIVLVGTVRSDRYEPLQTAPQLAGLQAHVFDDLRPMPPDRYREVICGPAARAQRAGSRLQWAPELVERLLADCAAGADALPLLSLTLARLYDDYGSGVVGLADYEAMGGMRRVVENEIDAVLDTDPETRGQQLEKLHDAFIPWLATINPANDQPLRRAARWADLPADSHPLIEALVAKRLLVKDERDGEVVVEVALESLLRQWDTLARWLREESSDLKDTDVIEQAAHAWDDNGRQDDWLLPGARLADAEALAAKPGFRDRLNAVREYLLASRQCEDQRLAEERRRHEAELQAARDRQEAAEALAAAEGRAKDEAQRHALVLRRRTRVLWTALALVMVAALAAGFLYVQSRRAEEKAVASLRNATAIALSADSQLMLSGAYPGVAADVFAMQLVLAARSIPSKHNGDFVLLYAVNQERSVLKIIPINNDSYTVAFSPDGKRLAVADGDAIGLWDTETWHPIGYLKGQHKGEVTSVAFSPDGTRIVSGSRDGTLRLWDAEKRQPIGEPMRGHPGGIWSVTGVAFSPDGGRIVSGSSDHTLRLWNTGSRLPIGEPMQGHTDSVMSVAFSPDGRLIASGGLDSTLRLWDAATRAPIGEPLGNQRPVSSVAFSPDGRRIVSASDTTLQRWDVATRTPVGQPIQGHTAPIARVVYSRDGTRIASASDDKTIREWDATTGAPIGDPLVGHAFAITGLAFDADGRRIVSSSLDRTFRVWDARGAQVFHGHQDGVLDADFSPDGKLIASSSLDQTIRQWDVDTGTQTGPLIRTGDATTETSGQGLLAQIQSAIPAGFSTDGRQIMGIGSHTKRTWDAATGEPLGESAAPPDTAQLAYTEAGHKFATLAGNGDTVDLGPTGTDVQVRNEAMQPIGSPLHHDEDVTAFTFSHDGHRIATGSTDFKVRIWDADTGRPIGAPLQHDGWIDDITFTRDRHTLAVADRNRTIRLWDVDLGKPIGEPMHQDGMITSVAFSPDGRLLATAGSDGRVRLWDVKSQSEIGSALAGHTEAVTSVEFSPDGTKVASASADTTIRVWPVPTLSPEKLCAKMTYNMSRKTWDTWIPAATHIPYTVLCPGLPIAGD